MHNTQTNHPLDIAWIIPEITPAQGGLRNIFNAVSYLQTFGHTLTVYCKSQYSTAEYAARAADWYAPVAGVKFMPYTERLSQHEVCFATHWRTACDLWRNRKQIQHALYFIQDYEPWFNPMGTEYLLAERTYHFGFHPVCSGEWMAWYLKKMYDMHADFFCFPLNRDVYNTNISRKNNKKNILFYTRTDQIRRCYQLGEMILSKFAKICPDVEIILYGSDILEKNTIPFPHTDKKKLPTLEGLADLYRNTDLGIVFSPTNPSLVPYEMMACGCPVCDLDCNDAIRKYGNSNDNVFLLSLDPAEAAESLAAICYDTDILQKKAHNGKIFTDTYFPDSEQAVRKIEQIIYSILNNAKEE